VRNWAAGVPFGKVPFGFRLSPLTWIGQFGDAFIPVIHGFAGDRIELTAAGDEGTTRPHMPVYIHPASCIQYRRFRGEGGGESLTRS